jgi:phage gpG-like protein
MMSKYLRAWYGDEGTAEGNRTQWKRRRMNRESKEIRDESGELRRELATFTE